MILQDRRLIEKNTMLAKPGPPVAPYPVTQQDEKGNFNEVIDMRMPTQRKIFTNKDLADRDTWYVYPTQQVTTFQRKTIGDGKLKFNLTGKKDVLIDWEDSYMEAEIVPLTAANTYLTSSEISTWQYKRPTAAVTSGGATVAAHTGVCKFMHFAGTHALFNKWKLVNVGGNPTIDVVDGSDVYQQVNLNGQKPEFYEQDSTCRCDDFAAGAIHFAECYNVGMIGLPNTDGTTVYPAPARMIPWCTTDTLTAAKALNDDVLTAPLAECIRTANLMVGGTKFKIRPALNYMNTSKFYYPGANPAILEVQMNTYAQAFYALNSTTDGVATTYHAAHDAEPTTYTPTVKPWSQTAYGYDYEIRNIRLVLSIYKLSDAGKNKLDTEQLGPGYIIDYARVAHETVEVPAGQNEFTYRYSNREIGDLQKIVMVCRESSNVKEDVTVPKLIFTNGEKTTACTDDTVYEGIKSIQWNYLMEPFPRDPVAMGPYKFREIRDITGKIWDSEENTLFTTLYEAVSTSGVWTKHSGTQFFIGWDFQKQDWAYKSGLSLKKGDLSITIEFNTGTGPARYFDFYLIYTTEITVQNNTVSKPRF